MCPTLSDYRRRGYVAILLALGSSCNCDSPRSRGRMEDSADFSQNHTHTAIVIGTTTPREIPTVLGVSSMRLKKT